MAQTRRGRAHRRASRVAALDDLRELRLERVPHVPLVGRCWELRSNMTAYDAAYVRSSESTRSCGSDRSLTRAFVARLPQERRAGNVLEGVGSVGHRVSRVSYGMEAAEPEAWRCFDASAPDPGYFQFDWLSARHPDLSDRFALSTVGLGEELAGTFDPTGSIVVDVGAGTGRLTRAVARAARQVIAIDAYRSVLDFGSAALGSQRNVCYLQGDARRLPLRDDSVDHVVCAWAELDRAEAHRVVRAGGFVFHMGSIPEACGELTPAVFDFDPAGW